MYKMRVMVSLTSVAQREEGKENLSKYLGTLTDVTQILIRGHHMLRDRSPLRLAEGVTSWMHGQLVEIKHEQALMAWSQEPASEEDSVLTVMPTTSL